MQRITVQSYFLITCYLANRNMSTEVVRAYDEAVAQLQEKHGNVDPFLLLKSSMLTRKYSNEKKQRFWLSIQYLHGANEEEVSRRIQHMVGLIPVSHGHSRYEIVLQTGLDTVLAVATLDGVESVAGEVYPNT